MKRVGRMDTLQQLISVGLCVVTGQQVLSESRAHEEKSL